uniref:Solute carrier organic anion transporter family member n=1 Tax=Petromyzon marinus TaxID=7757 RepID=A0AAJ7TXI7_PETMA|nr:solute carrier organic anion transporter family member 3A1 [Petromyzon marinus]
MASPTKLGEDVGALVPRLKGAPRPSCFANVKVFLLAECALMLAQGTAGAYLVSMLTTLERRFNLKTADLGMLASSFEMGNLALILFVSYFGGRGHRPRLIGCGGIVMALGALLSALPEFLGRQYQPQGEAYKALGVRSDVCRPNVTGETEAAAKFARDRMCVTSDPESTDFLYLLLIGAQMLLGVGATPVQPLGVSYIDDHVSKRDSSVYIGIVFTTLVFGPACGFMLGSVFTRIYVDAIFINTSKLDLTPEDPRWIGAWWAGFLLCAVFLFVSSLFMFGFPRSLARPPHCTPELLPSLPLPVLLPPPPPPGAVDAGHSDRAALRPLAAPLTPKTANGSVVTPGNGREAGSCCRHLRVIPRATRTLLRNPVFTCIVLAACAEIAVIAGFAAFLGKYLERQYNLTASYANQLLAMTAIPCACLGILLGGLIVRRLSLTPLGAARTALMVNLVSTACYVSFMFLGCGTGPVAGVTTRYANVFNESDGDWPLDPYAPCNLECGCVAGAYSPVCGSDGITYLSPCYAGCLAGNMSECLCVFASEGGRAESAVPGRCPNPECQRVFPTFLAMVCVSSLIGAMAQTPAIMILIRTVSPELKSYALGVQFLLIRLLGFIPPPLIFGIAIDMTCVQWSEPCSRTGAILAKGSRGACALYDSESYRRIYVILAVALKATAFLLYAATWACLRCSPARYLHSGGANGAARSAAAAAFVYSLDDRELCENMETVL